MSEHTQRQRDQPAMDYSMGDIWDSQERIRALEIRVKELEAERKEFTREIWESAVVKEERRQRDNAVARAEAAERRVLAYEMNEPMDQDEHGHTIPRWTKSCLMRGGQ